MKGFRLFSQPIHEDTLDGVDWALQACMRLRVVVASEAHAIVKLGSKLTDVKMIFKSWTSPAYEVKNVCPRQHCMLSWAATGALDTV